ncbi:MAG: hypothetical protein Q9162_005943 [Coniocarpon cinnabarinum]
MPSDIRSFFGGKASDQPTSQEANSPRKESRKRGRPRKIIDDEDEVDVRSTNTPTPKRTKATQRESIPDGEETTAAEYFRSSKKEGTTKGDSKPIKGGTTPKVESTTKVSPAKSTEPGSASRGRGSMRITKTVDYNEHQPDHDSDSARADPGGLGEEESADDIFAADYKNGGKGGDEYKEEDDMAEVAGSPESLPERTKKDIPKPGRKRKSKAKDDEDEEKSKQSKVPRRSKAKGESTEHASVQAVFDKIPTVRPPTPPPKDASGKQKFQFGGQHANSGPAPEAGSKEIPTGAENCLVGMSFVFTGLLQSLGREEGQELVKRYGGRIVGAPSKKTTYVVLGNDAGPSKLEKIKDIGIKTINEDGLFELIRRMPAHGGEGKAGADYKAKQEKEDAKVHEAVAEAEREEAQKVKAQHLSSEAQDRLGGARANERAPATGPDLRLWTVKYAPTQMSQICGNKGLVEKLQRWLKDFSKNQRKSFKVGGPDGSGVYRAVMLHGPPGIGKTTAAHLVAKLEGYDIVESNASDTRSKKLVEAGLKGVLSTTSLMGFFAGDGAEVEASRRKLVLIMDEVDGMSAGDRGGVGALASVCKKSQIPMILICNERRQPKMKPFDHVTYDLPFRRPTADQIRARIMTIAYREKMKFPGQVVDALVAGSRADIRQVVNMVSQAKLDAEAEAELTGEPIGQVLDYEKSKSMSRAWEKNAALKPWDILAKIMGPEMWVPSNKLSLNQKAELYFADHDIAPLMLQENYLGSQNPLRAQDARSPQESTYKKMTLMSQAADSFSEGDLCERMIRGGEQHWTLMPTHAILSFVRPASFVAGSLAGGQSGFPSYLGKLSTTGRLSRQVKEVQGHMRLRANTEKDELRMQYLPLLWSCLVKRLDVEGKDALDDIIAMMDYYYLTKEDWDSIAELGVDYMEQDKVKLETSTKAAFTRMYNQASHPMPFIKATQVQQPKKLPKEKPDVEEAIEESEEEVFEDEEAGKDDDEQGTLEDQLGKDKYIKKPKAKKATNKGKKAVGTETDHNNAPDEPPKKGKGKGKARK